MLPMNTPSCTASQSRFSGASYTVSSDQRETVRPAATSVISTFVEQMDSGTGQSILTRDVQQATDGTALRLAAFKGHTETVKVLLAADSIQVNDNDYLAGWTTLHCAALKGHTEIVKVLLAAEGINVNEKDACGWTPLNCAARYGHAECVKALLTADGIEVNEENDYGWTPLYSAASYGHAECVKALVTADGIEVNAENNDGWTPLNCAARNGHAECVKALLTTPGIEVNEKNNYGFTPLHFAARYGHTECVKALLTADGINVNQAIPLHWAAINGQYAVVEQFLNTMNGLPEAERVAGFAAMVGAVDTLNRTPLSAAFEHGHKEIHHAREDVLLTLDVADLESYDALVAETLAALKRLPDAPEDASRNQAILRVMDCLCEDGETSLSYNYVASQGQEQITKLLQAFPILSAARNGQTAIVTRILKILETWPESERCQAVTMVMTISNKDGGTALHVAAQRDQRVVVAHLLETLDRMSEPERSDAIPTVMLAVDDNGVTPLHWAAYKGHHEVVRQLLHTVGRLPETERLKAFTAVAKAADQKGGATALHIAAINGRCAVVEQFLNTMNGLPEAERIAVFAAMVGAVDTLNRTPLSAAFEHGHKEILDQLTKALPLLTAVQNGQSKSAERFMQALHALPGATRCSAIIAALKKTRADGATPLYIAASQGNVEIIKLLLGAVSELLTHGEREEAWEVLYSACIVEEEDGARKITPLGIAARNRCVDAVKLLLEEIQQLFSIKR